ncbi:uncharacterized protein LOC134838406 [Culicoides brevitarsis]|uniref:uncharacterized protein LOC134838406 n=1 Tax=Culicoides brevitarsis TaxID=469753 RepID=UPI00307C5AAC
MDLIEVSKTIKLRDKRVVDEISKELYLDTFDGIYTCDLIIKCGKDLFEYSAHRIILASASKFLYDALSTAPPGTISVLILPDIEPKTLKQILKYIYNGEITLDKEDNYLKFIEACRFLEIPDPILVINGLKMEVDEKDSVEDENLVDLTWNDVHDFDESSQFSSVESPGQLCQNMQNYGNTNFTDLTEEQKEATLAKAKRCAFFVYIRSDRKPDGDLNQIADETILSFKGTYIGALHKCGFCKKAIRLYFNKNQKCWLNVTLRNHLKIMHGVNNIKSVQNFFFHENQNLEERGSRESVQKM